jgi:hypothetical protein
MIYAKLTCAYAQLVMARYNVNKRLKKNLTSYKMAIKLCTPAEIEDHLETLKILLLYRPSGYCPKRQPVLQLFALRT